ncbi:unnamed protein product, partial [Mesorhabditis belari]|uniref:Non-specific protein-tyrosine kinase n=1 Tax=Mesorhabditis belari TaxID=2138241 RepID=A0AAF3FQH2_9BILA
MPPLYANFADREEFLREITFMKQLGFHPHLLTLLGCYSRSAFPLIIMELCDKGDLLNIAARNVLLTGNKFAKLGDFGLCRLSQDQHYVARGGRLPVKWTAPEALERNEFSNKSDIWSFGVFLFEMFSLGQQPYHSMQPEEILSFLREGRRLERPAEASERIWKVMCWCWKFEAKSRPKAHETKMLVYPSLEDMVVDQNMQANRPLPTAPFATLPHANCGAEVPAAPFGTLTNASQAETVSLHSFYPNLYPQIGDQPTSSQEPNLSASTPLLHHQISYDERHSVLGAQRANLPALSYSVSSLVAPITSLAPGFEQANLHHGVRNLFIPKTNEGKIGVRLTEIDRGLFVQFVMKESPAAHQGLRFGDQILQLNGKEVFGMGNSKAMQLIEKIPPMEGILVAVRDRPSCRVITLHKDENGKTGLTHKDNKITAVAPNSSASKNGLTLNQAIVEIDGISVVAYCSKEVSQVLENAPRTVSLTVMPWEKYQQLIYKIDAKLLRQQDHSVPISAFTQMF